MDTRIADAAMPTEIRPLVEGFIATAHAWELAARRGPRGLEVSVRMASAVRRDAGPA